jgi:hypothetical protein
MGVTTIRTFERNRRKVHALDAVNDTSRDKVAESTSTKFGLIEELWIGLRYTTKGDGPCKRNRFPGEP